MTQSPGLATDEKALLDMLDMCKNDKSKLAEIISHIAGLSGTSEGADLLFSCIEKLLPVLATSYQLPSSTSRIISIKIDVCSTLSNLLATDSEKRRSTDLTGIFTIFSKESVMKRVMKDALKEPEEDEKLLRLRTVIFLGNASALSTQICKAILGYANHPSHEKLNILERIYSMALDVSELGTAFLSVLSNLTQISEFRVWMMSPRKISGSELRLKSLLAYATFSPNARRREAAMAAVKNCCFTTDFHQKLLDNSAMNILPVLLLPLADGTHKYTDDENNQMMVELRYLDDDKKREPLPQIRMAAVEAIYQLCATKVGRSALRDAGAYLILREYHRWEEKEAKNDAINQRLFDVIEIIISDEVSDADKKFEDLHKVDIPEDLQQKFKNEGKEIAAK